MGICKRQGPGKLRRIDTQRSWIQRCGRDQPITLMKARGEDNSADLVTKHVSAAGRIEKLLKLFGCHLGDGRPALAPTIGAAKGETKGELLNWNNEGKEASGNAESPASSNSGKSKGRLCDMEGKAWWNGRWYSQALENDGTNSNNTPDVCPPHFQHTSPPIRDQDKWLPCACVCPL